ncbi:MAG: cytochrome P450 [Acidimicrobiia bacterium]
MNSLLDDVTELFSNGSEHVANPYPVYRRLQREAPVFDAGSMVLVTQYALIEDVLKDNLNFSPRFEGTMYEAKQAQVASEHLAMYRDILAFEGRFMTRLDDPEHARQRTRFNRLFTPKALEQLRAVVLRTTTELLNAAAELDVVDLVENVSYQLPLGIVCDLFGIPRDDRALIHQWSLGIGAWRGPVSGVPASYDAIAEFGAYVEQLLANADDAAIEAAPLLAALVGRGQDVEPLDTEEMISVIVLLIFAGHETTATLITNATLEAMLDRRVWKALCDRRQIDNVAVDELLRFVAPVQFNTRCVISSGATVGGVRVERGRTVALALGAGNRDPHRYSDPDEIDLDRTPNRHLAFGHGLHHCLGAFLTRLEASVLFGELTRRFPGTELASDPAALPWRESLQHRTVTELNLRLHP